MPTAPRGKQLEASGSTRLLVLPVHEGERLDRFLAAATALSRRRARTLAEAGLVWRNGQPVRVLSRPLRTGDVIDVLRPHTELGVSPTPELPPVTILHQDRWIVAVDKPAGVLSQPSERQSPGELSCDQRLLVNLALAEGRRPELHLVHRLDRLTSGVLLFSRHHQAAAALQAAWQDGTVVRIYLAVIEGEPPFEETVIDAPIARDPGHTWRFTVAPRGRRATTRVRIIARHTGRALAACSLVTGRTHQVRLHLAHVGFPVLGDTLYGARPGRAPRPLLHAHRLRLPHPRTGEPLTLTAPLPADLLAAFPSTPDPLPLPPELLGT